MMDRSHCIEDLSMQTSNLIRQKMFIWYQPHEGI